MTEDKNDMNQYAEKVLNILQGSPMTHWQQALYVHFQNAYEQGYKSGFQSGKGAAAPVQLPDNDTGLEETGLAAIAGEDRALERTTQTEDEQLEDTGYEVFRGILRQLGEAKRRGYEVALGVPDDVKFRYVFKDGEKPVDIVMTETKGT